MMGDVMTATIVVPHELRREHFPGGDAFSFRWVGWRHGVLAGVAVVLTALLWPVANGVRQDPGDVTMTAALVVLAFIDVAVVWATLAGLINRTTMTFEADRVWLRHGPVAVGHRGRTYARRELASFDMREKKQPPRSEFDESPPPPPCYVLFVTTRDGTSIRVTREVSAYYVPALEFLAAYGNAWLRGGEFRALARDEEPAAAVSSASDHA